MSVIITKDNIDNCINGNLPVVIDIWATWCGPCRLVGPIMDELSEEYKGKIVVGKCDAETNEEICEQYGIKNVPTILFFKYGEEVDRSFGAITKNNITNIIKDKLL